MTRNGQGKFLDHSIRLRSEPERAAELQASMNADRRRRIADALNTRPVFLLLDFTLPAAGQVPPIRDTTETFNYDIILSASKSDIQDRNVNIEVGETGQRLISIGNESNLYMRSDEFSGQVPGNGGQTGPFWWPTPLILPSGHRVTGEMYKTDTTAGADEGNIVLIGSRVYPRGLSEALLDPKERDLIERYIAIREVPRWRHLKVAVDFDSAVQGGEDRNIYTPPQEEPMLIHGMRTSLRYSNIELGLQGEATWTVEPTPIWGIAAEDELIHDNFHWFAKPVFLHSNTSVEIRRVVNGLYGHDSSLIDAQTGNTITFICTTV